jgi:RNA polymerase sigma-70 factor (ECF subfamily)
MKRSSNWPSTQSQLLLSIRDAQDRESWDRFVELYAPVIYHFALVKGLQNADAEDVVQEVITDVSRAISTFEYDPSKGRFRAWLGKVAYHRICRFHRGEKRRAGIAGLKEDQLAEIPKTEEGEWIEIFNSRVLESALDAVRPLCSQEQWRAFDQLWVQDQPPKDVAQALDRPIDWVYKTKSQVLKLLKREVERLAADVSILSR